MDSQKNSLGLILAIIFASAAISGSLVFFGIQAAGKANCDVFSVDKIKEAIKSYAEEQQTEQVAQQEAAQVQQDKQGAELAKQNLKPVTAEDHVRGEKTAKITLVNYSDFECPYCKRFHPTAIQLLEAYGGDVNWVYRHYPLDFHNPMATKEAEASECIAELGGNDKFWEYLDLIYDRTQAGGNGLTEADLLKMAGEVGVNSGSFKTCLDSGRYTAKVKQQIADADKAGVAGTPANIFVNNATGEIRVLNGAASLDKFKKLVNEMLGK